MNHYGNIPVELTSLKQWVCVKNDSKLPRSVYTNDYIGVSDSSAWGDFPSACAAVASGKYDGIGFVFNDNGIIGIDLDDGFDSDGFLADFSRDIVGACKSYTEKSRSCTGLHIFVKGNLPFTGRNNRHGVEIYKTGRYFITTGKVLIFRQIIENQAAIDYVVDKYFSDIARESKEGRSTQRFYSSVIDAPHDGKIPIQAKYPVIAQGCRNQSLTSLAGQLHNIGWNKNDILQELLRCNDAACKPPLSSREVQVIVNSVTRYQR